MRLRELAHARQRWGYLHLHVLLRREGWKVDKKRTYRIYREEPAASSTRGRWTHGPNHHAVKLEFIRPGKPVENAFIESFSETSC